MKMVAGRTVYRTSIRFVVVLAFDIVYLSSSLLLGICRGLAAGGATGGVGVFGGDTGGGIGGGGD